MLGFTSKAINKAGNPQRSIPADYRHASIRIKKSKGIVRIAQALTPYVALLLFIKSTEYLFNPASSIQYPVSSIQHLGRLQPQRFCPNNMTQL
jgi:hypothetical protein